MLSVAEKLVDQERPRCAVGKYLPLGASRRGGRSGRIFSWQWAGPGRDDFLHLQSRITPRVDYAPRVFAAVTGQLRWHLEAGAQRQAHLLPVEAVLHPPPAAAARGNFLMEAVAVEQLLGFSTRLCTPSRKVGEWGGIDPGGIGRMSQNMLATVSPAGPVCTVQRKRPEALLFQEFRPSECVTALNSGGAKEDRTPDLVIANDKY